MTNTVEQDVQFMRRSRIAKLIPLRVYQDIFNVMPEDVRQKMSDDALTMLYRIAERAREKHGDSSTAYWRAVQQFEQLQSAAHLDQE